MNKKTGFPAIDYGECRIKMHFRQEKKMSVSKLVT